MFASLSPAVAALLILTPVIIAGGQILFKQAGVRGNGDPFVQTLFDPVFIVAVALYGLATLMWVYVLKAVPLSFAYTFMALSYVLVPLLAVMFLGETLNWRYGLGALLIIAGLLIVQS